MNYKTGEFAHLLDDIDPVLVIVQSPFAGRDYAAELNAIDGTRQFVVFSGAGDTEWAHFVARGQAISTGQHEQALARVQGEDIAQLVYTSGTTGRPKGAMLSHRAITWCALSSVAWMGDALTSTIMCAPISHVGGLNFVCMNVFTYGGKVVFHERVDMPVLAQLTAQELPTYLVAGPTAFAMLFAMPGFDPSMFFGMYKLITFGGAPTPEEVLKVIGRSGARMATIYGQTETTSCAACSPAGVSLEVMSSTIGRELDGVQIRIASAEGSELATGEVGEIQIKGPCVMSGYHRNEEATRDAFTSDGFLKTGDLGQRRADDFVVVVGRLKEMFKSGGYNVYPLEVESAINQYPGILLSVVVAMPDDKYQEVGHAFVVPAGAAVVSPAALTAYLKDHVANYKVPKQFSIVAELPMLSSGKVDRKLLRERVKASVLTAASTAPTPPTGAAA